MHLDNGAKASFEGPGWFQFPSNGKVHLDADLQGPRAQPLPVSIPFKREGASGRPYRSRPERGGGRVSIPFKREGASGLRTNDHNRSDEKGFNSLQTGRCIWTAANEKSISKALQSFNSLQTGRCIWTRQRDLSNPPRQVFQFPSNGKVHLDNDKESVILNQEESFNSLQTGRCIWTPPLKTLVIEQAEMPRSKRDLYKLIFDHQSPPKMPENPDGH